MVDSVRFPPSIGGSGRTYTNDANPETGLYNGGHRSNFFPMLDDTARAAGYVRQYAQAIDGAKGNADRAEDALGFIEAVAAQYEVNIKEQYARRSTYRLNFAEGVYKRDEGSAEPFSSPGTVFSVDRSTPKTVIAAGGRKKSIASNALARRWDTKDQRYSAWIEERRSNLLRWSEDFSNSVWDRVNVKATDSGIYCAAVDANFQRISATSNGATDRRLRQSLNVQAGQFYTSTFYLHSEKTRYAMVFLSGAFTQSNDGSGYRMVFDLQSLEMKDYNAWTSPNVSNVEATRLPDGSVKIVVTAECFSTTITTGFMQLILKDDFSSGTFSNLSSGEGVLVAAAMAEEARSPGSYIKTESSPVSRVEDVIYHPFGDEFNPESGSIFIEYRRPYNISRANIIKVGLDSDSPYNGLGIVSSQNGTDGEFALRGGDANLVISLGNLNDIESTQKICFSWDHKGVSVAVGGNLIVDEAAVPDNLKFRDTFQRLRLGRSRLLSGDESSAGTSQGDYFDMFYIPAKMTGKELAEVTQL